MTNNLQLQDVYSIRGLTHGTTYDLKVANIKYISLSPHCGGEGPEERESDSLMLIANLPTFEYNGKLIHQPVFAVTAS